jgi:hypothetical protein
MFDEEERREELKELFKKYFPYTLNMFNEIVSDEKSMIAQAKKEAREEFAERLGELYDIKAYGDWTIEKVNLSIRINGLLEEYNDN